MDARVASNNRASPVCKHAVHEHSNDMRIFVESRIEKDDDIFVQINNEYENVTSIGSEEGEDGEILGSIADVEIVEDHIFILDSRFKTVRVFDGTGRHVESVGGPGAGPGEFTAPCGLSVSAEGVVWVADADRSISVFVPSDTGYVASSTFRTHVSSQADTENGSTLPGERRRKHTRTRILA